MPSEETADLGTPLGVLKEHVQLGDHLGLLLLKARAEAWPAAEGPRNEHRLLVRRKLWQHELLLNTSRSQLEQWLERQKART